MPRCRTARSNIALPKPPTKNREAGVTGPKGKATLFPFAEVDKSFRVSYDALPSVQGAEPQPRTDDRKSQLKHTRHEFFCCNHRTEADAGAGQEIPPDHAQQYGWAGIRHHPQRAKSRQRC